MKSTSDCFTKEKRSWVMSKIRCKGNHETEVRLAKIMRGQVINGWRRHLPLIGRPDFSFKKQRLVVFVDGCFWHGCPRCFRLPKQNRVFWRDKIGGNRRRDRSVNGRLRRLGWKVIRIRECQLKHFGRVVSKIRLTMG
jgi:DNA mismatch endonuclease (patch repair protein)